MDIHIRYSSSGGKCRTFGGHIEAFHYSPRAREVPALLRATITLFLAIMVLSTPEPASAQAVSPSGDPSSETTAATTSLSADGFTLLRGPYGTLPDGREADLFTLRNPSGMEIRLTNYAGVIVEITVPDRTGTLGNVVESYPTLEDFRRRAYVNALIGRYANRISGASFAIDGVTYTLARNNGANSLHGGPNGFHRKLLDAEPFVDGRGAGVIFRYTSPDGEEGFPGAVEVEVTYLLTAENALVLDYRATTDRTTHLNLTNHAYFNLSGVAGSEIFDHTLTLNASGVVAAGVGLIPTGEILSVAGTPFDFRRPVVIGDFRGRPSHPQLALTNGDFDHNFVIDRDGSNSERLPSGVVGADGSGDLFLVGRLEHQGSGRVMEVLTTKPGIQLYTGRRTGVALETQYYPDTPNRPDFPSSLLRPGEEYRHTTVYRFSVAR